GDWHIDPEIVPVAPAPDVQAKLERLYGQVVNRAYVNAAGEMVMLTIAYGGDQSDALKVHRQENCYAAQGFDIHALEHARLDAAASRGALRRRAIVSATTATLLPDVAEHVRDLLQRVFRTQQSRQVALLAALTAFGLVWGALVAIGGIGAALACVSMVACVCCLLAFRPGVARRILLAHA